MDLALPKCVLEQNFQLLTHPPTLVLQVSRVYRKFGHYEKMRPIAKLPLPTHPPKLWVSSIPSVDGNGRFALVIMK